MKHTFAEFCNSNLSSSFLMYELISCSGVLLVQCIHFSYKPGPVNWFSCDSAISKIHNDQLQFDDI